MYENIIKHELLSKLSMGAIQPFQVEDELRLKCLPEFEVARVRKEIMSAWESNHQRY